MWEGFRSLDEFSYQRFNAFKLWTVQSTGFHFKECKQQKHWSHPQAIALSINHGHTPGSTMTFCRQLLLKASNCLIEVNIWSMSHIQRVRQLSQCFYFVCRKAKLLNGNWLAQQCCWLHSLASQENKHQYGWLDGLASLYMQHWPESCGHACH